MTPFSIDNTITDQSATSKEMNTTSTNWQQQTCQTSSITEATRWQMRGMKQDVQYQSWNYQNTRPLMKGSKRFDNSKHFYMYRCDWHLDRHPGKHRHDWCGNQKLYLPLLKPFGLTASVTHLNLLESLHVLEQPRMRNIHAQEQTHSLQHIHTENHLTVPNLLRLHVEWNHLRISSCNKAKQHGAHSPKLAHKSLVSVYACGVRGSPVTTPSPIFIVPT